MRGWLKLAVAEVRAEFPSTEVSQAFRIFNISPTTDTRRTGLPDPSLDKDLERLASVAKVPLADLREQYLQFRDFAVRGISASKCDNKTAWKRALDMVSNRRASTRNTFPYNALKPVLLRYFAFCASTSGVEQTFTLWQVAVNDRQPASRELEWAYTKAKADVKRDSPEEICKSAQKISASLYSRARASGSGRSTRIDKGIKRKLGSADGKSRSPLFCARGSAIFHHLQCSHLTRSGLKPSL